MGYPGATVVTGPVSLSDAGDSYPTHWSSLGKGGHSTCADLAARDAIPAERREFGMTRTVITDADPGNNKTFRLCNIDLGGVDNDVTNNDNWIEETSVAGVTSVGLSLPSIFNVTGSPVTGSGTLSATLNVQVQKTFFAGPASGADATPGFRTIQATDLPDLSTTYVSRTGAVMTGALTLSGLPVDSMHAASKQYVDALITGLTWKTAVACATTANIALTGEQTIDGIVTSASRVLVKDQTDKTQNGIYVSGGGAWTRATDADSESELTAATVLISGGTINANTQWTCITKPITTLGVTELDFTKISANANAYTNGVGLTLAGTQFSITTGGVVTAMLADANVTKQKFENVTQSRLLGRYTASDGVMQEITIGNGLALSTGGLLGLGGSLSGSVTITQGSNSLALGASGSSGSVRMQNSSASVVVSSLGISMGDVNNTFTFATGSNTGAVFTRTGSVGTNIVPILTMYRNLSFPVSVNGGMSLDFHMGQSSITPGDQHGRGTIQFIATSTTGGSEAGKFRIGLRTGATNAYVSEITTTSNWFLNAMAIGTNVAPATSAVLDLVSTSKALLLPRVSTEANITTPVNGMIYYNSTSHAFKARKNGAWVDMASATLTAGNGTVVTGTAIDLGGALTSNTYIQGGGNILYFGLTTKLLSFIAYTTGTVRMLTDRNPSGSLPANTTKGIITDGTSGVTIGQHNNFSQAETTFISIQPESTNMAFKSPSGFEFAASAGGMLITQTPSAGSGGFTAPAASAILELNSSTRAFLVSRMSADANVVTPVNGMIIYNTTSNKFRVYENGAWVNMI
jgi:hypothetical protein